MRTFLILLFTSLSFSIYSQTITVTSPSGGDTLVGGQTYTIGWTTTGTMPTVDLFYLRNGVLYTIQSTVANTGSYTWVVPGNISSSNNGFIRVKNSSSALYDQNDQAFRFQTAPKSLTISYPNALTDTLQAGVPNIITWNSTGTVSQVRLLYSLNNGTNYSYISFGTSNTGSFTWTPPNALNTSQLKVKIVDKYDATVTDESDTTSILKIGTTLTLNSPTPKNLLIGGVENLQWSTTGNVSHIDIAYSKNYGAWINIADSIVNSGIYNWTIPTDSSNAVRIRLQDAADPAIFSITSGFSLSSTPQFLTITNPNGGEIITEGSPYVITWNSSSNLAGLMVLVDYSLDSGLTWMNHGDGPVDSLKYAWDAPLHVSTNLCLLKVHVIGLPGIADTSDNVFSIVLGPDEVVVDQPNGGEKYLAGSYGNLGYHTTGIVDSLNYYYSIDGGNVWIPMSGKVSSQKNFVSINWPDVHSSNCKVKFEESVNPSIKDSSDAVFTISKFRLTRPYPNTTVYHGATANFTWGKSSSTSDTISLFYTINNGLSWILISDSVLNNGFYVWSVPQDSSDACRIKIVDNNDGQITDEIGNFKIHPAPFKINTPNGGEFLASQTTDTIRWANYGNVNRVNLSYTIDGGLNWTSIASFINNTGEYVWTTPNITSSTVQLKISDFFKALHKDISDTTFSIGVTPPNSLLLSNPNGGNMYGVGSTQTITWTSAGSISAVDIYYSIDNGLNWTTIALNEPNDSSYTWIVPNVNSNQCLVKINENGDATVADSSNTTFSIGSSISLNTPNGGEVLNAGNSYAISWNTAGIVGNIDLLFSSDSGVTWSPISMALSGTTYLWTVPNIASGNCLIRAENGTINDESDQVFTIVPMTGNHVLLSKYYFNEGTVEDDLGTYHGARYNMFTATDRFGCDNHAMYNSNTVDGYITLGDVFDPVVAAADSSFAVSMWVNRHSSGTSGVLFSKNSDSNCGEAGRQLSLSITSSGKLQFVSHYSLGFGNYTISQSSGAISATAWHHVVVNYNGSINTSGSDRIEIYIDNVLQTVTSTGSGGTLGDIQDGPAHFGFGNQIKSDSTACGNFFYEGGIDDINIYAGLLGVTDVDNLFLETKTCPTKKLTITTPAINDIVTANGMQTINWTTVGLVDSVDLYYSIDGGFSFNLIAAKQLNNGTYTWLAPSVNSTECLIRIEDANDAKVLDESDDYFKIEIKSIQIIVPNNGQTYNGLASEFVRWSTTGIINAVNIYFSSDSGVSWNPFASNVINNPGAAGYSTYYYTVPNISSTQCLFRVADTADVNVADTSDIPFVINFTPDSLTLTNPNGGNYLTGGNNYNITWFDQGTIDTVSLYYSVDSGATFSLISGSELNNGVYNWNIPNVNSTNCIVKIEDASNAGTLDVSDAVFTISEPHQLLLNHPNGGELIEAYAMDSISWSSSGLFNRVDIYVSVNNGLGWQLVEDSVLNTGQYIWNTPAVNSMNCLVRIEETGSSLITDTSNAVFEIGAISSIELLYPNGGETLTGGVTDSVLWKGNGNVFSHNVQFSPDSGATWMWIGDDPLQNEIMYWTVPNINSTLCLIVIAGDTSDATFTINKNNIGVKEHETISLNIYPNPTSGVLQIETNESIKKVQVYDMRGKHVLFKENAKYIDLSNQKDGVFIVEIEMTNGEIYFSRIIKQ